MREKPLIEAVASSLTELFAPSIHRRRIDGMLANYAFIDEKVVAYFRRRLDQAPKDADFALEYVKRNARTVEQQRGALAALSFKTDVLWAQLDALHHAYVCGAIPPGAFRPAMMPMDTSLAPRLPRGVKLRRDDVRQRWTLLAPERIFEVDATAAAVLELCDGERDLAAIVAELAARYNAPAAVIEKDVVAMLGDLKAKRVLDT